MYKAWLRAVRYLVKLVGGNMDANDLEEQEINL